MLAFIVMLTFWKLGWIFMTFLTYFASNICFHALTNCSNRMTSLYKAVEIHFGGPGLSAFFFFLVQMCHSETFLMSHLVLDECCLAPLVPNETLLALWHLDRNGWPSLKVCATRHSLHRRSKGLRRPFTTATCWEGNKRDVSTRASTRRHGSSQMVFSFWFFFFFQSHLNIWWKFERVQWKIPG